MKNTLMIMLATGGLLLFPSTDARAQSWRLPGSGFGVSLNAGQAGYGYQSYRGNYRHFDRGHHSGYLPGYGYGQVPISYGHIDTRSRYSGYNGYRIPSYRYVAPRRSYNYGCRYGY